MTDDRMGGIALIVGSAAMIVTMAVHPTGHDLFEPGNLGPATHLNISAHSLGILSLPILFLGTLALSRRLHASDRLAVAGQVLYGFAVAAGMAAAVVSGLVGSDLAGEIATAEAPVDEAWWIAFHYNGMLNQAFANVLVVASSAAILLWSAAMVRSRAVARGIGIYGLFLSPIVVLALLSGHVHLDVHGFGAIVLGQSAWFIAAGLAMSRTVPGTKFPSS